MSGDVASLETLVERGCRGVRVIRSIERRITSLRSESLTKMVSKEGVKGDLGRDSRIADEDTVPIKAAI